MFLCNPIGVKAEVGDIVETWDINNTDADTNPGTIKGEFSEYRGTMLDLDFDPDKGTEVEVPVEGLALTLTIPSGDYTITPAMMEEISNKALEKGKNIYSMTIVGEKEAQILDLDGEHTTYDVYRRYLNNNFADSNNPDKISQFALIEVDFQVPIVDMNGLFRDNETLEVIQNLTFSDQTPSMDWTFFETPKLRQIPDPFIIPQNVKHLEYTFAKTGLEILTNLTIEDAEFAKCILNGANVSKIEDWNICIERTLWLFSGTKIQEMNNIYIKGNSIEFKFPTQTLERVKGLTLDMVADDYGNANASQLFIDCKKLTEAEVTLNVDRNVESLGMIAAFKGTGLSSTPKNFKIPESITSVSLDGLFAFCPNLSSVSEDFIIPKSVLENSNIFSNSSIFIGCPKLRELPKGFVAPLSYHIFAGCNALTSLPEGFCIGDIEKLGEYKNLQEGFPVRLPMFGKVNYPEDGNDIGMGPFYEEGFVKVPTIALPLKVDESLKKYQELGEVNFTQKLFFAGLPSDMQEQEVVLEVGDAYLDSKYDLRTKLETIKNNLENKGYKDINFILKPYEEPNPIAENYAKFRSLSTRDVGALDNANSGKLLTDFITELENQTMDCNPKVIEVKYSGGVVASTPDITVTPVYTDTSKPYDQTEWTKDNITVNIVAKDDVNGIDKIIITDPNGTITDVSNTTQSNEFTYGHQIPVTDMTTSGEYTYTYQTVNKQGSSSDEISVTIRVDVDKPQASIENGILKANDQHSGVKEIKLPNGTVISWTDDYGNNGYEVSEYGTYEIYDNAGNVTEVIYKATAVTEPAITLSYEKDWTNKDVMVEVTITKADEVALLEFPDGTTRVLGDENTFTTSYLVQEEGEKDYRFAITKKTREEGNLVETAHIKLDKTAPTSSIVTVNGKNYLKASDALSGVSHLISPSGKTIMWLPEYEQNGYQIEEDGTYQVYDRAGNNGERYGTQIKEEVTPIAPIPTIPSFPEENKTEPETDKKTEDKKEPETDKKTEDKKEPETDKKPEDKKESKPDKKTEDKKESKPDKKTEDKKESKPDKKTEDKTADKQSKEDGTLEYSKTPETPTDVEIKLLTPDGKIETIYIPEEKVYLLESGETIFGRDIGYPFIDRIYYGGKGRPIIVGLNGEEYQCLNVAPVSETVMSDSKHGTLVGTSNTTSPKTGDNIIQVLLLFMFSGVLIAGVSIRNRRKTMK